MKINTSSISLLNTYDRLNYKHLQKEKVDRPTNKKSQEMGNPFLTEKLNPINISKSNISQQNLKNLSSDQLNIIESLIENFTGKDVEIVDIDKFYFLHKSYTSLKENLAYTGKFSPLKNKLNTDYNKIFKDAENIKMDLEMTVKTAEGKELDVNIELDLSQEFIQKSNFAMKSKNKSNISVLNITSKDETIFKSNLHFEIDIVPASEQVIINGKEIEKYENSVKKVDGVDQLKDVLSDNEIKNIEDMDDSEKGNVNQQYLNYIFNFFNIWSKNKEEKFLLAFGMLTQEKIYLSPVTKFVN